MTIAFLSIWQTRMRGRGNQLGNFISSVCSSCGRMFALNNLETLRQPILLTCHLVKF